MRINTSQITDFLKNQENLDPDSLVFGAIKVDSEGKVVQYNEYEAKLAKRSKDDVIGKNFFDHVAPCTKRPEFYGRFREGVEKGELDAVFEFVFKFDHGDTNVECQ